MVLAQESQAQRVDVSVGDAIPCGSTRGIVRLAKRRSCPDPPSGHPDRQPVLFMITTWRGIHEITIERSAVHLAGPDDKGRLEEPSGFEVLQQPADRLVELGAEPLPALCSTPNAACTLV